MKRFLYIPLICFTVLILLCIGAIIIGHLQPEASFIPELQFCGTDLCYLGITPGTTTWAEGLAIIRQASQLKKVNNQSDLYAHDVAPIYAVGFSPDSPVSTGSGSSTTPVMEIDLRPMKPTVISAGEVVTRVGIPCYLTTAQSIVYMFYTDAVFVVAIDPAQTSLTPESLVTHIVLQRTRQGTCPDILKPNEFIAAYKWQGFRSYPTGP